MRGGAFGAVSPSICQAAINTATLAAAANQKALRQPKIASSWPPSSGESAGASAMADLIYGSSIYDLGLGYERIKGLGLQLDRWFASAGARTKIHTLSMSLEGHIGSIDGSPEYAAAAGLGLALSRGLSANVGINYREANVVRNGINVLVGKDQSAAFSMRYSY